MASESSGPTEARLHTAAVKSSELLAPQLLLDCHTNCRVHAVIPPGHERSCALFGTRARHTAKASSSRPPCLSGRGVIVGTRTIDFVCASCAYIVVAWGGYITACGCPGTVVQHSDAANIMHTALTLPTGCERSARLNPRQALLEAESVN